MDKYFNFKDAKIKNLINDICQEHWDVSRKEDNNMGYLWYMYAAGHKKGDFRPFIFMSEINLLLKTEHITKDEKDNMLKMLFSEDEDNANITAYSILTLRKVRIEEKGLWTLDNENYKDLNYTSDIINPEFFTKPQ
jgi:hypothetical protein